MIVFLETICPTPGDSHMQGTRGRMKAEITYQSYRNRHLNIIISSSLQFVTPLPHYIEVWARQGRLIIIQRIFLSSELQYHHNIWKTPLQRILNLKEFLDILYRKNLTFGLVPEARRYCGSWTVLFPHASSFCYLGDYRQNTCLPEVFSIWLIVTIGQRLSGVSPLLLNSTRLRGT